MHRQHMPAFDQAMQFLFERHGNSISEDLVAAYCACGYLRDDDGQLSLTHSGMAELQRRQLRTLPH